MAAFGWWFVSGKFENRWAIDQLASVVEVSKNVEPDHMVAEKLAEAAETFPLEAVRCLKMIVEGDQEGWRMYGWREYAEAILRVALQDGLANQEAQGTIQYLGSCGYLEFRDLLP